MRTLLTEKPKVHIRSIVETLGISFGKIWTILREKLKLKAYRPHITQLLSPLNITARLFACNLWLTFSEDQFDKILFSDEKGFVLHHSHNRKNDVFGVQRALGIWCHAKKHIGQK